MDDQRRLESLNRQAALLRGTLVVVLIVGAVGAYVLLAQKTQTEERAQEALAQTDVLTKSVKAEVPALLFTAHKDVIEAATLAEAEWRLAAEEMATDAYGKGFRDALNCAAVGMVEECQMELAYRTIPSYPTDPGYIPSSVKFPKSAIEAAGALQAAACGEKTTYGSFSRYIGLESVDWSGKWSRKLAWLLKAGCKDYGVAVGSVLMGDPPGMSGPWKGSVFEISADARGIPAWLYQDPEQ